MTKAYFIIAVWSLGCVWIGYCIGFGRGVTWYKRLRDKTDAIIRRDTPEHDLADWWKRSDQ